MNNNRLIYQREWCPGHEWGGSQPQEGSTELCIPKGGQMHLQQVWTIRHNWKVWWPLYPLTQHHQWKGGQFNFPSCLIQYFLFCQIYVLLWFWFVFLSTVSAIQLIWRILSITSRRTREFILRRQTHEYAQVKQLQNPIYVSNYWFNFSKSMLPSAVPSSAWETGSSSSRWGRMWMSTCFQTSWSKLGWLSRRCMIYQ